MKQTKYITSGGLAFFENRDMEKLRQFSLKGWHVKNFKLMGYTLEKGKSLDYIYNIDYRWLQEDEKEEYFEFFSSSGWSHIASEGYIHLFRADAGTKQIYTDRDTKVEKYKDSSRFMMTFSILFILITALAWGGVMISSDTLESILFVAAVILSAITLPTVWTAITTYSNKWKVEGRNGLAQLGKMMPFFLLSIAMIILLFVDGADKAVGVLTSGMIGAIVLPTAIWAIMSILTKWRSDRG